MECIGQSITEEIHAYNKSIFRSKQLFYSPQKAKGFGLLTVKNRFPDSCKVFWKDDC